MIKKNTEKGLCPFRKLNACSEKCAFYRKGLRYSEQGGDPIPFEECAINIIADNLEAMHNRTYMMQREVGDAKNIIALKTMVDLSGPNSENMEVLRRQLQAAIVQPDQVKKLK